MSSLPAAAAWDAASPGTSPSSASPTSSCSSASRSSGPDRPARTPAASATSSRIPRTSSCRSNRSRMMSHFEEIVGTPIDFHQDGYLFLLSKSADVETFKKNVALQQQHGVDVRWVSAEEARELSPGLDTTGVKGATYCPSDGVTDPNGVTMGFAKGAQAKGVEIVRDCEVNGARLTGHRVTEVRTSKGDISTPIFVNAAGPVGQVDRPPARRRRAGRAGTPPHLHRLGAGRRIVGRPAQRRPRADVEDPGDRFRHLVLLPPRGRRIAVRDGRSGRGAGIRHHRAMGFPAEGDRGRDAAPAGARRRRGVARVGRALRDDAGSQSRSSGRRAMSKASTRSPDSAATASSTRPRPAESSPM